MRASGLIPVIPLTIIIKILSFNCVLENKRSITDALTGTSQAIYTSQVRYTMYCTIQSMNRDLVRPSPATRGGRATGINDIFRERNTLSSFREGVNKKIDFLVDMFPKL